MLAPVLVLRLRLRLVPAQTALLRQARVMVTGLRQRVTCR